MSHQPSTTTLHAPNKSLPPSFPLSQIPTFTALHESQYNNDDSETTCWNPVLRKQIAAISSIGILETAYLTYDKIQYASNGKTSSLVGALCSADSGASSCNDVLHGPYASLHLGSLDVPLSTFGMAAYTIVFLLAALPLISPEGNDSDDAVLDGGNRIAVLGGTILMASFSVYLVSLLLGVLHASCLFCFVSAGLSISMAALSWNGGMLPNVEEGKLSGEDGVLSEVLELRKTGVTVGASSVGVATVMALGLFVSVTGDAANSDSIAASTSPSPATIGTLVASTVSKDFRENAPPAITTTSSPEALALASDLNSLNSRMFGAFWCSHCYDQKQAMGFEAMQTLPYLECDKEGYKNQRSVCVERKLPGYPTWEIGGKLFPGEKSVEELREIVDDIKAGK